MNFIEKKKQLAAMAEESVLPLISDDYVLYGLPYYNNIGDTLIWDGELELLEKSRHKCVGVCGWDSYPGRQLPENVVILITGGGYFGDLWRDGWQAVLDGIKPNRNNKIIFLPNTIYYNDEKLRDADADYLSGFPNLTILVRDNVSYETANRYFRNPCMLVPDMAFCMDNKLISTWAAKKATKKVLLFKRNDKECPESDFEIGENEFDVSDWLPMERPMIWEERFHRIIRNLNRTRRLHPGLPHKLSTPLYRYWYRRMLTRWGLEQLSGYERIYTTRLHAMILGIMLGRDVVMIDNKFGKLSSFYNTWLLDCDNVKPIIDRI